MRNVHSDPSIQSRSSWFIEPRWEEGGGEFLRNTFAQETNTIGNVTLSRNRAGRISYGARIVTAPQKR